MPMTNWEQHRREIEMLVQAPCLISNISRLGLWSHEQKAIRICLAEIDRLTAPPDALDWKELVRACYAVDEQTGVERLNRIVTAYHMRGEEIARLEKQVTALGHGHGEPCYYCGKQINSLAGDPRQLGVGLCHADDPGRVKPHHVGCVSERLQERDRRGELIGRLADALGEAHSAHFDYKDWQKCPWCALRREADEVRRG